MNDEISPMRSAMPASSIPSKRIQSRSNIGLPPACGARAPDRIGPQRLAEALAVLMVDLVGAVLATEREAALERLANRLDDRARTPGGTEAAALLGAVGAALMRLEG